MDINKYILLSLSLVLILGIVESFEYHEKELQSERGLQGMYDRWRSHHKVMQKGPERFNVFKYNAHHVHKTNKMNKSYKLKLNSFADLTAHEFRSIYPNSKIGHYRQLQGAPNCNLSNFIYKDATDLPPKIDWREKNAVGPVKSQGACGSCWAFSAVAAVEGLNAIRTGKLLRLSEQQLIDCDMKGNNGCNGGQMEPAFNFIKEHGGLASDESYPYKMARENCDKAKFGHHSVTLDGGEVLDGTEDALLKAVAHQPVSIAVDTNAEDFALYATGVFTGPCGTMIDHGMTIVGYDETPEGMKYWIVKNSWGPEWGDKGYMNIQRGGPQPEGLCAINMNAVIPLKDPGTKNIEL